MERQDINYQRSESSCQTSDAFLAPQSTLDVAYHAFRRAKDKGAKKGTKRALEPACPRLCIATSKTGSRIPWAARDGLDRLTQLKQAVLHALSSSCSYSTNKKTETQPSCYERGLCVACS